MSGSFYKFYGKMWDFFLSGKKFLVEFHLNANNIVRAYIPLKRGTAQVANYVIITYFFAIFWLQTSVTKKWPFYNVISVHNSNVIKKGNYIEQTNNVIVT